ncbi:hypothetical protein [Kribbella deserti]|uniref:PH domain-containing protein n=1 Tax=Kribbella deserti TaxID=1926257 RepID=A0ABV6QQP3_9ACTN
MANTLDAEVARRWLAVVVPSWIYRYLLPALWAAAVAVSLAFGDEVPCSEQDPSSCGPDVSFALSLVICLASLVLWWWMPRLAACFGIAFAALEVAFDDTPEAVAAWGTYGGLCLLLLAWFAISRNRQLARTRDLARRPVVLPPAERTGFTWPLAALAVAIVVAVAGMAAMRLQDAEDPDWFGMVAEPADNTWWYTVSGSALLLGVLLAGRDLQRRRNRPTRPVTTTGLPVRIAPAAGMRLGVFAADDLKFENVLGFVGALPDDPDQAGELDAAYDVLEKDVTEFAPASVRRQWETDLRKYQGNALLVGDLTDGAWVTLVLGDTVMRASRPFRAPRTNPLDVLPFARGREEFDGLSADEDLSAGDEQYEDSEVVEVAQPAGEVPALPWQVPLEPAPWWSRLLLVAPFLIAPPVLWFDPGAWQTALLVVAAGGSGINFACLQLLQRLTFEADVLAIRSTNQIHRVPWQDLRAIDVAGRQITFETEHDLHVVGGFDDKRTTPEYVASVAETIRRQARPASAQIRPAPGAVIVVAYVLLCAAVFFLRY